MPFIQGNVNTNIVNDQHGIPTYATDLAIFTLAVLGNKMPKYYTFQMKVRPHGLNL